MEYIGQKEGRLYYLTGPFLRMSPAGLVQVSHVMVKDSEDDWPAPIGSIVGDGERIGPDEQLAEASGYKVKMPGFRIGGKLVEPDIAAYLDLEAPTDE